MINALFLGVVMMIQTPPDYEDVGASRVGVQMEAEQTGETTSKPRKQSIKAGFLLLSWMRAAFVLPNMSDRLFCYCNVCLLGL